MSLILDHVSYSYDVGTSYKMDALKDVSFKINEGEFVGLIGHTGSGKSTLIQLLNGLLKPTAGNIYYCGKDINDSDYDRKALRSHIGLVFQYPEHQLFEETVFKDVCFGPKNLGLDDKEINLRAFDALEKVKLEHEYFYQSPFDLSGGQKRRVAIAGILAMKPDIFILDEPTAGLDPKGAKEILSLVKKLQKDTGMTVILVSHNMDDVANFVDRILVMDNGTLKMDGTPRDVFQKVEELEKMGLRAPEVSYIVRGLRAKGLQIDTDVTTVSEARDAILKALRYRNS